MEHGATAVVIEHDLDMIANADYVVEGKPREKLPGWFSLDGNVIPRLYTAGVDGQLHFGV